MMKLRLMIVSLCLLSTALPAAIAEGVWQPFEAITRNNNTLDTLKHRIVVDESGLPQQFFIKPGRRSLPLEMRGTQVKLEDPSLVAFGRGAVLRAPMRLEAAAGGNRIEAQIVKPAAVSTESAGAVSYISELTAGPIAVKLTTTYECDGTITVNISYKTDAPAESLELLIDINGPVTHAFRGLPADFRPDAFDRASLDVSLREDNDAIVWSSLAGWLGAKQPFVNYLYFGSLDRGFTWLCDDAAGFKVEADTPMFLIQRDRAGQSTARIFFINQEIEAAQGEVTFALLAHPSKTRNAHARAIQWLEWKEAASMPDGVNNTTFAARKSLRDSLTDQAAALQAGALSAGAFESFAAQMELKGFAGADLVSVSQDNVRLYPASLFAVMAGPYRGVPVRVYPNIRETIPAGERASYDRQLAARAIVHDIGAAVEGFRQPVEVIRLVQILDNFGYFDADGDIEMLPYWRNSSFLRYGEDWQEDEMFRINEEDPAARVYVTAFKKAFERGGKRGHETLIILLNENDTPVNERLHVLDTEKVFGGPNRHAAYDMFAMLDFGVVPQEGDWEQQKVRSQYISHQRGRLNTAGAQAWLAKDALPPVLRDMEDNGFIEYSPSRYAPPPEIYGPLFIYPRDYRIVYGYSVEE